MLRGYGVILRMALRRLGSLAIRIPLLVDTPRALAILLSALAMLVAALANLLTTLPTLVAALAILLAALAFLLATLAFPLATLAKSPRLQTTVFADLCTATRVMQR